MPASVLPSDPRLNPYASLDNLARADAVRGARPSRGRQSAETPGLSVVILNLDKPELLLPLIEGLDVCAAPFRKAGLDFEVIVGDTGSSDPRVLALYDAPPPWLRIVRGLAYHFSRCNNDVFFAEARHDHTLFLNNDVIFKDSPEALWRMDQALRTDPGLGAVGPVMFFEDGLVQHAGIDVFRHGPLTGFCFHPHSRSELPSLRRPAWSCPAVTGACLMIRSALFEQIGGFDEGYRTEAQDVALCLAARRLGYNVQVLDLGRILHLENATRTKGSEDWEDRQRFMRRWSGYIAARYR
ncbi:MAG: glycosyltransferase [Alphaproteobacteria bacterium]|nr:glycosyltransferase [Alphaproteobacteria bacterium]